MTLKEALRHLIESKGLKILSSPIVLNILSDYKAFDEYPCSKNILKNVISEGYLEKIAFIHDNQLPFGVVLKNYLTELHDKLGLRKDVSCYVLNSIMEALGYNEVLPLESDIKESNAPLCSQNSEPVSETTVVQPFETLSRKDQEKRLFSLIEYNSTFCQRRNLKIEILEVRITGKRSFEIDYEVLGEPATEISFEYSVFDQTKENGGSIECWRYSKHDFHNNRLFRTVELDTKYPLSEISRIRIKLDEDWD